MQLPTQGGRLELDAVLATPQRRQPGRRLQEHRAGLHVGNANTGQDERHCEDHMAAAADSG